MNEGMQEKPKLREMLESGYEQTGRTFKCMKGEHKGKEFPVYAQDGDVAGLVYNYEEDKIEMVYKLVVPHNSKNNPETAN